MSAVNYSDLDTRGFVVVPNVLSEQDVERITLDYKRAKQSFDERGNANQNYNMLAGGPHKASSKIAAVVDEINRATDIDIDIIAGLCSYFDTSILQFGWHQDHEPFFMWQLAREYVNFWIPLIKPKKEEANVRVVPFDKLPEDFLTNHVFGRGAQRFESTADRTVITSDDEGKQTTLEGVSFDHLFEIPEIGVGDALIMRGDLIHDTQRTKSFRVAVSIKALNCYDRVVTRSKFFTGSNSKQNTINKNVDDYAHHLMKFNGEGVDSFCLRELFPRAPIHYSEYKRLT